MAAEFQKGVNLYQAPGVPGSFAGINPAHSAPFNYRAKTGVKVGGFVWDNGDGTCSGTGSGAPIGFVHRDHIYTFTDITTGGSLAVPEGQNVEAFTQGDFFASPAAAVTKGQKVFAVTADGTLKGGTAAGSVSGAVETPFYWAEDVDANAVGVITTNFI